MVKTRMLMASLKANRICLYAVITLATLWLKTAYQKTILQL
jgi:hypothetical protein